MKIYKDELNERPELPNNLIEQRIAEYQSDFDKFICNPNHFEEVMLLFFQIYLETHCKDKNICFIDVGAAEGVYSCVLIDKLNNTNNTVIAFEPEEARFRVLVNNLTKRNNLANIEVHQKIVTNNTSNCIHLKEWYAIDPFTGRSTVLGGGSATIVDSDDYNEKRVGVLTPYQSIKLDDISNKYEKIDILKIDVEGSEDTVIAGAQQLIKEHRPVIFLEVHKSSRFNFCSIEKIRKQMGSLSETYTYSLIQKHGLELEYWFLQPEESAVSVEVDNETVTDWQDNAVIQNMRTQNEKP